MDLATLKRVFDRLNADDQLLLIDFLADQTDFADELTVGLQRAAVACFGPECADNLIPQGSPLPAVWREHAEQRDARLELALRGQRFVQVGRAA